MAAAVQPLAPKIDIDTIPDHELISNLFIRFVVCPLKRSQRAIRKNDPPAVGYICRIALDNDDIVLWIGFFYKQAAVETGRATTKYGDFHCALLPSAERIPASRSSW